MANTQWNGEPCAARRVTVTVADNTAFPMYWARRFVGMRRKAVEVQYGAETFYLDDEDGSGWNKVTHGGSPWWTHSNLTVEPGSVEPREPAETPETGATQATDGAACSCGGRFPIRHLHADEHRPASTDQAEPATITDPAYLREQYAAAVRDTITRIADLRHFDTQIANAVMRVRDRHLQQLRQRLALADAELAQWAAAESADAAAGSYAGRAEEAEQQRDQLAADLRYALDDHGPRHSHIKPGRWDDTGKPCDHCTRLEQARQHLAHLDQPKEN